MEALLIHINAISSSLSLLLTSPQTRKGSNPHVYTNGSPVQEDGREFEMREKCGAGSRGSSFDSAVTVMEKEKEKTKARTGAF